MDKPIKYQNPKELKERYAEYNPRRISAEEYEQLKRSIEAFGFVAPIVINTRTNRIIAGHQRIAAAIDLGIEEIPTIEADVDEAGEKVLNVALNRIKGKFDMEKLDRVFEALAQKGAELTSTGFTDLERENIRIALGDKQTKPGFQQLQFHIEKRKVPEIRAAIRASRAKGPFTEYENENANGNGNALARIAETINKHDNKPPQTG